MFKHFSSKIIFGIGLCLVAIALLDSHVDGYALNSKRGSKDSSSSESSSSESSSSDSSEENGRNRRERDQGWNRDRDWNRGRDRDDKNKKKFKCPSSYGKFADVEDCSSYFSCQNWKSNWKSCQKHKRFDRYRRTCLPFIIAVCDDGKGEDNKLSTPGDTGTTTPRDSSFTCPSFMGEFPHPDDCSRYYDCTFFIPSVKTCPKNQLFDGVTKKCKSEEDVNCGSRKKPTSEATVGTTPIETSSTQTPTTPQPTTMSTPTPQPTTSTVQPTDPESTTTTMQPTPTDPEPTATPSTTTLQPTDPEPTTTTLQPTTTTLQPTTTTLQPTTPEPTTTTKPTGPPETNCDEDDLDCIITETGENPVWFECSEAVGAYLHPSSNKLFIFCKNWEPFVKKCGQDLIFSNEMRTCITPS